MKTMRSWVRPAIAAPYVAAAQLSSLPPHRVFRSMTPTEWYWLNVHGHQWFPSLRGYLPAMPPEEIQVRFTGGYGEHTLREAFSFYRVVSGATASSRPEAAMDFGCGWGRITRFGIRDFDKSRLIGVDPIEAMIEVCRDTNPWATFQQIGLRPPIDLPAGSLDVIFAFSVFSHLTEEVHLEWIEEFSRLLRRGGTLVVTTREREFIEECERLRTESPPPGTSDTLSAIASRGARSAFHDTQRYLDLYDAGHYCCDPIGAGDQLPTSTYGETCIPRAYAQRHWEPYLSVTDFLDQVPGIKQNVIVARRR